jgi:hypothetical protein
VSGATPGETTSTCPGYRSRSSGYGCAIKPPGLPAAFLIENRISIEKPNRGISAALQKFNCCYALKLVASGIWYT